MADNASFQPEIPQASAASSPTKQRKTNALRTTGRLLAAYARLDLVWFTRDLRICILTIITDAIVSLSGVAGMYLLAGRLAGAAGFTRAELLFMLGCALLVDGVYALLFFNNNAGAISRVIGRGQLDHALIQPVPLSLHFLTNGIAPVSGCGPFLCGATLTIVAAAHLPQGSLHPFWLPMLAGTLLLSLAILVAWVWGISAIAFWAPYAAEEIAPEVTELFSSLAGYPLGAVAHAAQFALCTLLPVGAIAWLPARILLGKTAAVPAFALLAATAAVTVMTALLIFRKGMKHYAKYTCPRYTGFGR